MPRSALHGVTRWMRRLAGIAHGVEQLDDTVLCSLSVEGEVGLHSRGTPCMVNP